ncbi:MAG: alpha/beta fold hydrolase, partial [Acidimicrobiia bacterium]
MLVDAGGIKTNYLEAGDGQPVVLVHGSGPGVSAYANWRLTLPALAPHVRVLAPDMVGFGFTNRPGDVVYGLDTWVDQLLAFLDALEIDRASLVGNSFGGALALRLAADHPDRVERLVLMGSAGLSWPITDGLEAVWGYEPSVANMGALLDLFAYDRTLVTDELAEVRYRASAEPGVQEAFSAMFPPPRQRWLDALATPEERIAALGHETLIVHGREDRVVPLESSQRLNRLIPRSDLVTFGRC